MTPLNDVGRLLRQEMGLDIASIGVSALERAVQERQRACSVANTSVYVERVRASEAELQSLIETIVVPETWFFRDREAFAALVRFVREEWLPTHEDGCLRLLSLPCSTGEEPYSMAMALLDAGVPPSRFRVDAIDICGRSLVRARRGVYGKSSFRGVDAIYRERHFERVAGAHAVNDAVRQRVNFQHGNVLSAGFLPGAEVYDVIFCRNMLIYFDRETQDRAVSVVERLLTPTGLLFTGSSETGVFLAHSFSSAKVPMAFAFRKARPATPPRLAVESTTQRHFPWRPLATRAQAARRQPIDVSTEQRPVPAHETALKLADQGHLVEASRCCEDHLRRHGPSAEVFHVLGLVRDASGNADDAAMYYKKALYLDPRHQDALVHLALLMEKQGHKSEAETLWNRARRLAAPRAQ